MYFINPFKGLRPSKEKAPYVAITSTDHLSKELIADHKKVVCFFSSMIGVLMLFKF